jgi:methyltransferase (TIGR00027 family)
MSFRALGDVSETALWAAVLRAEESARADAIFRDPFAEKLAGERGRTIASGLGRLDRGANGWAIVVRTRIIDDLLLASIAEGCDCVLSLAAGLDSRPYRLALPPELLWVEADLPALVEQKTQALASELPACRVLREKVDLSDPAACKRLFSNVASSAENVVVLSEGVLLYLEEAHVGALARGLAEHPSFRRWITDLASPGVLAMMRQRLGTALGRAPVRFAPLDGIAYFERRGWTVEQVRPLGSEGVRLARVPRVFERFARSAHADPRSPGNQRWAAVVELARNLP